MTPEELFRIWRDDPEEHHLIFAHDWNRHSAGLPVSCEACGRLVSMYPASKAKAGPRVHLLCRRECMSIALKVSGPIKWGGRIIENVLPERLRKA